MKEKYRNVVLKIKSKPTKFPFQIVLNKYLLLIRIYLMYKKYFRN